MASGLASEGGGGGSRSMGGRMTTGGVAVLGEGIDGVVLEELFAEHSRRIVDAGGQVC